jgi:Immunity protein 50
MISETPEITGAQELVSRLGRWPSFHDAEIIQVQLVRDAPSTLTVRLMGPDDAGALVTFIFENILDLTLTGEDVNGQNVIAGAISG